jgi:hypothetical protein
VIFDTELGVIAQLDGIASVEETSNCFKMPASQHDGVL